MNSPPLLPVSASSWIVADVVPWRHWPIRPAGPDIVSRRPDMRYEGLAEAARTWTPWTSGLRGGFDRRRDPDRWMGDVLAANASMTSTSWIAGLIKPEPSGRSGLGWGGGAEESVATALYGMRTIPRGFCDRRNWGYRLPFPDPRRSSFVYPAFTPLTCFVLPTPSGMPAVASTARQ